MCEVGALYLTLTGASGFLAALLEEELKSLLKLGMRGKKAERRRERESGDRERQHTRTDMQTQAVAAAVLDVIGEQLEGSEGHFPNIGHAPTLLSNNSRSARDRHVEPLQMLLMRSIK